MTVTTTQKIIKIGTSKGATLPAKELARLGVEVGDEVRITIEPIEKNKHQNLMQEYDAFKAQYGQTLKNLADR